MHSAYFMNTWISPNTYLSQVHLKYHLGFLVSYFKPLKAFVSGVSKWSHLNYFKVYRICGAGALASESQCERRTSSLLSLQLYKTIDDCDMQISPFQHTARKLSVAQFSGDVWLMVICLVVSLCLNNMETEEWPKENKFLSSQSWLPTKHWAP